jgi:hypothetical protein
VKRVQPLILYLSLLVAVAQPPAATGLLLYDTGSTYIGGAAAERPPIAVTLPNGNTVLAFTTSSAALPTTAGAYMAGRQGGRDGYVEIRTPQGALVAATYVGTSDDDEVRSMCVTADGSVVVAYASQQTTVTTTTIALSGPAEEFSVILRLPTTLGPPTSSVQFESAKPLGIASITERVNGELWFVGTTEDEQLSVTATAAQGTPPGDHDCYIVGTNATLTTLVYASYLGTKEKNAAVSILGRTDRSMIVVWNTQSDDEVPTSYVTRLLETGAADWTTTLRGTDTVDVLCATLATSQDVIIGGRTTSDTLPSARNGYRTTALGGGDGFLSVIAPDGTVRSSTFVGTDASDRVTSVGTIDDGRVIAGLATAGSTSVSADAWQTTNYGSDDILVCVYDPTLSTLQFTSFAGGSGADMAAWIDVDSADAFTMVLWTTSSDLDMPATAARRDPPASELPDNAILRSKPRDTISVSPLSINMDTVTIGDSAQRTFHIRNHGQLHTVQLLSISTLHSGEQVALSPAAPWPLRPQGDSVVHVVWRPQTAGVLTDTIVENVSGRRFNVVLHGVAIDSTLPPPPPKPRIAMEDVTLDSLRVGDSVHTPVLIELLRGTNVGLDSARVVSDTLKCSIVSFPQVIENKQSYADVLVRATSIGADSATLQCWYADTSATAVIRWVGKDSTVISPLDIRILPPLSTSCVVDNLDTIRVPIRNVGTRMTEVTVEIRDVQTDPQWILGPIIGSTVHFIDPGATDTILYAILASELGEHGVECRVKANGQTWKAGHVVRSRHAQPLPIPTDVDFDRVEIGHDSIVAAVIVNPATVSIRVDSVRLQAAHVQLVQPFTARRLAAGASDSVLLRFTPTDTMAMSGTLTWWSSTAAIATTQLKGRGRTGPPPDTSQAEIDLRVDPPDSLSIATPTMVRMVIRNVGSASATLQTMVVSATKANVSLSTPPPYGSIAPGDSVECMVQVEALSEDDVTLRAEARAAEDTAIIAVTIPVRRKPDTPSASDPVRITCNSVPMHLKIGEGRVLPIQLAVGHAWLMERNVTDVQMRIAYRNTVVALDSSNRSDVLLGTTRTTLRKSALPTDTTLAATLVFTGCLGDHDTSVVVVDSIEFYAGPTRIYRADTTLTATFVIDDAWSGGPRYVQLDTSQAAVVITPSPSSLPLQVRLYHADQGGVLDVYDNTGNLTSSWTIAPTLPAAIVSVTIPAGLASGTYTAVFHTGFSTAVQRFIVVH